MGKYFGTNRILPIGESYWRSIVFIHHSVAWKGAAGPGDGLFDACLQIDGDAKPNHPPQKPFQPAGIRFGTSRTGAYQSRLLKVGTCNPIPRDPTYGTQRRRFGQVRIEEFEITDRQLLGLLKGIYDFGAWSEDKQLNVATTATRVDVTAPFTRESFFKDWSVDSRGHASHKHIQILYGRFKHVEEHRTSELLDVALYECSAVSESNETLLKLLGGFEERLNRLETPQLGAVSFVANGGVAVLFKRGRFVIVVLSAGRRNISVLDIAATVDRYLQS